MNLSANQSDERITIPFDKSIIPHKPGVYIYKDKNSNILYVGKAIDLYNRISSYFNDKHPLPKTAALVQKINSCETIEVGSEIEALILEANLIKKYLPPYNIKLTDDKDYLYIAVTNDLFPQIITARKNELGRMKEYFGPFPSSKTVKDTLKKLRRTFPWCNIPLSEKNKNNRPCFYYHLGLCPGACTGKVSKEEYNKNIDNFIKFMQGKTNILIKSLTQEMKKYSDEEKFESASKVKKILNGINYLMQSNKVEVYLNNPNFIADENRQALEQLKKVLDLSVIPERIECYDISNISGKFAVGAMTVLTGGEIDKKSYRKFKIKIDGKPNDFAMMSEMIGRRIKHTEWASPDLFLIDGGRGQVRAAYEVLNKSEINTAVFGLAKREEWLYSHGDEIIKLPKSSPALKVLQKIRDEAHRFGITYHRKLRNKATFLDINRNKSYKIEI